MLSGVPQLLSFDFSNPDDIAIPAQKFYREPRINVVSGLGLLYRLVISDDTSDTRNLVNF